MTQWQYPACVLSPHTCAVLLHFRIHLKAVIVHVLVEGKLCHVHNLCRTTTFICLWDSKSQYQTKKVDSEVNCSYSKSHFLIIWDTHCQVVRLAEVTFLGTWIPVKPDCVSTNRCLHWTNNRFTICVSAGKGTRMKTILILDFSISGWYHPPDSRYSIVWESNKQHSIHQMWMMLTS